MTSYPPSIFTSKEDFYLWGHDLGHKTFPLWGVELIDGVSHCTCERIGPYHKIEHLSLGPCDQPGKHPFNPYSDWPRAGWQWKVEKRGLSKNEIKTICRDELHPRGFAIVLGRSGLCGIDVDPRNGGMEQLAAMLAKHGNGYTIADLDADCFMKVRTGSGGIHWYFKAPAWYTAAKGCGKTNLHLDDHQGVEFGSGNKVFIGPYSPHKSGRTYELLLIGAGKEPPEFIQRLAMAQVDKTKGQPDPDGDDDGPTALRTFTIGSPQANRLDKRLNCYIASCPPAIQGRDGSGPTFGVAKGLVIDFDLSPAEAMPWLQLYNQTKCEPQWSTQELQHKLDDANAIGGTRGAMLNAPLPTTWTRIRPGEEDLYGPSSQDGTKFGGFKRRAKPAAPALDVPRPSTANSPPQMPAGHMGSPLGSPQVPQVLDLSDIIYATVPPADLHAFSRYHPLNLPRSDENGNAGDLDVFDVGDNHRSPPATDVRPLPPYEDRSTYHNRGPRCCHNKMCQHKTKNKAMVVCLFCKGWSGNTIYGCPLCRVNNQRSQAANLAGRLTSLETVYIWEGPADDRVKITKQVERAGRSSGTTYAYRYIHVGSGLIRLYANVPFRNHQLAMSGTDAAYDARWSIDKIPLIPPRRPISGSHNWAPPSAKKKSEYEVLPDKLGSSIAKVHQFALDCGLEPGFVNVHSTSVHRSFTLLLDRKQIENFVAWFLLEEVPPGGNINLSPVDVYQIRYRSCENEKQPVSSFVLNIDKNRQTGDENGAGGDIVGRSTKVDDW